MKFHLKKGTKRNPSHVYQINNVEKISYFFLAWKVFFLLQKSVINCKRESSIENYQFLKLKTWISYSFCITQSFQRTHLWPFSKSKFNLKSDRVNLVALASPVHRARYSTNWDRKGWPGSEIQMYYGCPWISERRVTWTNIYRVQSH